MITVGSEHAWAVTVDGKIVAVYLDRCIAESQSSYYRHLGQPVVEKLVLSNS